MLGGLDCIAMAVEHLERSETTTTTTEEAPPQPHPVIPPGANHGMVVNKEPQPTTMVVENANASQQSPPPSPPPAPHQPPPPPLAVVSGELYPHHFTVAPSARTTSAMPQAAPRRVGGSPSHNPTPHPSSFMQQPRLVSDAEDMMMIASTRTSTKTSMSAASASVAAAVVAAAASAAAEKDDTEDAARIEELRGVIFAPDLNEWKMLSAPEKDDAEDSARIEELRGVIFAIDLNEWKTLSAPSESAVITTVTHHDVLCGRGGETNHHKGTSRLRGGLSWHPRTPFTAFLTFLPLSLSLPRPSKPTPGNIVFRMCVKACQPAYIEAKRRDKPYIAQRIVLFVRKMGGRFLKRERDSPADAWKDVGNGKAREKTSQALREGAPELRGDAVVVGGTPSLQESNVTVSSTGTGRPGAEYHRASNSSNGGVTARRPPYEYDHHHPAFPPPVYSMPPAFHHHPHSHQQPYPSAVNSSYQRPSKKLRQGHGGALPAPQHHPYHPDGPHSGASYYPPPPSGVVLPPPEHVASSSAVAASATATATATYEYAPQQPPMVLHPHPEGGYTRLPGSPRVTVSADEEERGSSSSLSSVSNPSSPVVGRNQKNQQVQPDPQQQQQYRRQPHRGSDVSGGTASSSSGPRLKLLKKRVAVDVGGSHQ